jgi:hypothetical protein
MREKTNVFPWKVEKKSCPEVEKNSFSEIRRCNRWSENGQALYKNVAKTTCMKAFEIKNKFGSN